MHLYRSFEIRNCLPEDLQQKLHQFQFPGEAEQTWEFIISFIANGSREFFVEWTDHGFAHLAKVLDHASRLISPQAISTLTPDDTFCLCTAVLLHDVAMRFNLETLGRMLDTTNAENFNLQMEWRRFCFEIQHWDAEYLLSTFGPDAEVPKTLVLTDLRTSNYKVVGEFIRRHHGSMCQQVVANDFADLAPNHPLVNALKGFQERYRELLRLSGIMAWSHTTGLREGVDYLAGAFGMRDRRPPLSSFALNVHYAYIMALLRLSDYLDFRNSSSQHFLAKSVHLRSPLSQLEHATMEAYMDTVWGAKDQEDVLIQFSTKSPTVYRHVQQYVRGIQQELDVSWAVLSEHYSSTDSKSLAHRGLTARRVAAVNLSTDDLESKFYNTELRVSVSDSSVIFLLASPLYNNDPRYALREIIANAHDACCERSNNATQDDVYPINISIDSRSKEIEIVDHGVGMSLEDVSNYFLKVGGRMRASLDWKSIRLTSDRSSSSTYPFTSHFGVGVVSLFMLGRSIEVFTQRQSFPGVHFSIQPQTRELLAERGLFNEGTRIVISADDGVLSALQAFISDQVFGAFAEAIKFALGFFRFLPVRFPVYFSVFLENQVDLINVIPALEDKIKSAGIEWGTLPRSGHEIRCFVLSPLTSSKSDDVIYNGIPLTLQSLSYARVGILVILDDYNTLKMNLQKTQLLDFPRGQLERCYNKALDALFDSIARREGAYGLLNMRHFLPNWIWNPFSVPFAVSPRLIRQGVSDGYMPSVFFFKGTVQALSPTNLRATQSKFILGIGIMRELLTDLKDRLPSEIPTVIFDVNHLELEVAPKLQFNTGRFIRWAPSSAAEEFKERSHHEDHLILECFFDKNERSKERIGPVKRFLDYCYEMQLLRKVSTIVILNTQEVVESVGSLLGPGELCCWTILQTDIKFD
jgi:hypothetical protein